MKQGYIQKTTALAIQYDIWQGFPWGLLALNIILLAVVVILALVCCYLVLRMNDLNKNFIQMEEQMEEQMEQMERLSINVYNIEQQYDGLARDLSSSIHNYSRIIEKISKPNPENMQNYNYSQTYNPINKNMEALQKDNTIHQFYNQPNRIMEIFQPNNTINQLNFSINNAYETGTLALNNLEFVYASVNEDNIKKRRLEWNSYIIKKETGSTASADFIIVDGKYVFINFKKYNKGSNSKFTEEYIQQLQIKDIFEICLKSDSKDAYSISKVLKAAEVNVYDERKELYMVTKKGILELL